METGDTRHVILRCRYTEPFRNLLRDKMEQLLIPLAPLEDHYSRSLELRDHSGRIFPQFEPQDPMRTRWPILCAWGWLVTTPAHERFLRRHQTDGTGPRVEIEQAHDLSYRGIIPMDMGRTILQDHPADDPPPDIESFSCSGQPASIDHELEATSKRQQALGPALLVQHLLLFGLRRIRFEYMQRIHKWSEMQSIALQTQQPSVPLPTVRVRAAMAHFLPLAIRIQT